MNMNPESTNKAAVVVPNWNGEEFLRPCLDSLLAQSMPLDVIVVENGSTDDSAEILSEYKSVTVLKQSKNLGFAGGVNVGIRHAIDKGTEYVLLFNNDAEAAKDWAEKLIKTCSQRKDTGIVCPKLLRDDRRHIDSTGDFYSIFGLPFPRGRDEEDHGQYDSKKSVFGASGGASIYKAAMLRDVGLFDEDFFAYYEDVDLSFRAQLRGWKVIYEPAAKAYHRVSGTSSRFNHFAVYQTAKNFPYIYIKNMPGRLFFKYLPKAAYWYARMFGARLLRGGAGAYIRGAAVGFFKAPKKFYQRRKIQARRRVDSGYIDSILYHRRPPRLGETFDDEQGKTV